MEGAVFGRDIVAVNPPLIWYLSLPVVALSEVTQVHPATVYRWTVTALTLASIIGAVRWQRSTFGDARFPIALFSIVAAYAFFIDSRRDFGQREYLALVLCLPYIMLVASRVRGGTTGQLVAAGVGCLAGLGVAIKPHFLAVPACIELTALAMTAKRLEWFRRPETIAGFCTVLGYALFLIFFVPEYLFDSMPVLRQVYWGFNKPVFAVAWKCRAELIAAAALLWAASNRERRAPEAMLFIATAIGFLLACLAQMKGYSYHIFPIRTSLLLAAASLATVAGDRYSGSRIRYVRGLMVRWIPRVVLLVLIVSSLIRTANWYAINEAAENDFVFGPGHAVGRPRIQAALIKMLDERSADESFLAISTHPYPGFPTALYVKPRWSSQTNSRIFLPAIAKLRAANLAATDPRRKLAETIERNLMLNDLRRKPSVVLLDARPVKHALSKTPFNLLAFYLEDGDFRTQWSQFREVQPIGSIRVFVRKSDL
jgi:hypothetical protein